MSKNTNLSFLTDYITADITNGRIGINNASPSVAFDVTGIARTSTSTYLATASGNVGIGTTSPAGISTYTTLDIRGATGGGIKMGVSASSTPFNLQQAGTDAYLNNVASGVMYFFNGDAERMKITSGGDLSLTSGVAILNRNGKKIELNPNSALTNTTAEIEITSGMDLFFKLGGAERMRIASAGNVLIGTTSSGNASTGRGLVTLNGSSNAMYELQVGGSEYGYVYHGGSNGNMYFNNSRTNGATYIVTYNNGVYLSAFATSWTANSDIRLKNIISPIDSAVNKLNTLNPVIFSWKSDEENKENIGLIAQEVKEVLPQVIDTNEDGFLGVRYVELVPILVKAIQELSAEITLLKNK